MISAWSADDSDEEKTADSFTTDDSASFNSNEQ